MGTDYAWLNHTRKEYFHERRWYRAGNAHPYICYLMSHFPDAGSEWEPADKIELVVTDSNHDYEGILMKYTEDDAKWECLDTKLRAIAVEWEWFDQVKNYVPGVKENLKPEDLSENEKRKRYSFFGLTDACKGCGKAPALHPDNSGCKTWH